jgi:type VI secretion system protein ImpJ
MTEKIGGNLIMTKSNKILWAEGTLLGQQHFQQWDHYHESRLRASIEAIAPFAIGIQKLIIDETLLITGQLLIKQCQIIFPQGIYIDYDDRYDSSLTLSLLKSVSPLTEIYLCIVLNHSAKNISGYPENNTTNRWLASYETITDDYDAKREREVGFLKPQLILLRGDEDRSNFYSIKIFDLLQEGREKFELSSRFIPQIIHIHSSFVLKELLRAQIELISAKIRLLRDRRKQFRADMTEFNHSDLADFLLLQLFNHVLPGLEFYFNHSETHPKEYYFHLSAFLNTLSTFSDQHEALILPKYDHENLSKIFFSLDDYLKSLLESVIPSRMHILKLIRENDTLYSLDNIDSHVFIKNSFYLAVLFESENIEWLNQFSRQVKIGARSMIESIVASALPGVRLIHTQRPPNKLPVKSGYEYFYLEPIGVFWEQIKTERTLSLFTPYDFIKSQIELVTVEE